MNHKLIKASVAGAAALALAAGGSTFAAWSDFKVAEDQNVGAGELVLTLEGPNGQEAVQQASFGNFAPGEGEDRTRFLMSQQGDAVPVADLFVKMENLQNADNLCSSDSEELAEAGACNSETTGGGEFGQTANIKVEASAPTTAGNCGTVSYSTVYDGSINGVRDGGRIQLGSLSDGQGICMRSTVTLPYSAGNETQGDSSEWDWRFDLEQQ